MSRWAHVAVLAERDLPACATIPTTWTSQTPSSLSLPATPWPHLPPNGGLSPPIFPLPALPSLIRSTSWEEPLRDVPLARVGRACPDHPLAPLRPIHTSTSPRALLLLLFPALAVQRAPLCDTHACATPMPVRDPCHDPRAAG